VETFVTEVYYPIMQVVWDHLCWNQLSEMKTLLLRHNHWKEWHTHTTTAVLNRN